MHSLRIVLADDEFLTRMDLKEMLAGLGHQVVAEARNGPMALELVEKLRPDMAILDIKMPKMDGIKVAKLIAGQKLCAVLMLSAYSEEELILRAMDAGVTGYITKPVIEKELEPALRIAWARYQDLIRLKDKKVALKETLTQDIQGARSRNNNGARLKK